jgi:hypothetical protein
LWLRPGYRPARPRRGLSRPFFGSVGPLVIMVTLKTLVDLFMHVAFDLGHALKKPTLAATSS